MSILTLLFCFTLIHLCILVNFLYQPSAFQINLTLFEIFISFPRSVLRFILFLVYSPQLTYVYFLAISVELILSSSSSNNAASGFIPVPIKRKKRDFLLQS